MVEAKPQRYPRSGNAFWEMQTDTEVALFTELQEKHKLSLTAEQKYWKLHAGLQTVKEVRSLQVFQSIQPIIGPTVLKSNSTLSRGFFER